MRRELKDSDWKIFEAEFGSGNPEAREKLARYLDLLLEENEKINLTSITDWNEAIWKHLYDSLLVLKGNPSGLILDWGTGGGTPGIPLAIWAKATGLSVDRVTLLDSVGKKIRAVDSFVKNLGLSAVFSVQTRGEEFIARNKVDTVIMRAVAPPERVLGWISKRVPKWIFLVGPQSFAQWQASRTAFDRKGFDFTAEEKHSLPYSLGERYVLVLQKKR